MAERRPNILLVTTDQQRTDTLSCYGSVFTRTPNLDKLGADGVIFDRAYCPNPVCTPSRASIFSGLQVSRHGAWNIGTNVPEDVRFLSHRLAAVGYRTHYVGKAHFQAWDSTPEQSREGCWRLFESGARRFDPSFTGPYYGFDRIELAIGHGVWGLYGHYGEWVRSQVSQQEFESFKQGRRLSEYRFGGDAWDWDMPVKYHNSVWVADRTIDFLDRYSSEHPFFLAVGFQDPHHPHSLPKDFSDRVDPSEVPSPDFDEGELEDKPAYFLEAREGRLAGSEALGEFVRIGPTRDTLTGQGTAHYDRVSEREARLGRAYYYSLVKLIDQQMGRILAYLDESGLSENTWVIFTSDHGELLGDHGLWRKGAFHYEQLLRIPLIMRWPEGIPAGRRCEGLFSHVDIAPTIVAALAPDEAEGMDGVNALPMIRGEVDAVRDSVLIEFVDDPKGLRLKTIVTGDRKLTWFHGQDYGELYDLVEDPREKVNLWDHPNYARDKAALVGKILDSLEPLESHRRAVRTSGC
jgi:arylsulfatase A-like enzyme